MKISAYQRDGWYKIVAENGFGERSQYGSLPGDGIYEYLSAHHRLNQTFIEYWLVRNDREEDRPFLEFLLRANDHRTPRKLRLEGWEEAAGLSEGEVPSKPKGPGDVTVYGSTASATIQVLDSVGAVPIPPPTKKKKRFGVI